MTSKEAIRGILPIAPTPFTESGDVDFDGQWRSELTVDANPSALRWAR
jgi:hypothetical protein